MPSEFDGIRYTLSRGVLGQRVDVADIEKVKEGTCQA